MIENETDFVYSRNTVFFSEIRKQFVLFTSIFFLQFYSRDKNKNDDQEEVNQIQKEVPGIEFFLFCKLDLTFSFYVCVK